MTISLDSILVDCGDPHRLGAWWARALDGTLTATEWDDYTVVVWPGGARLGFQRVSEPTPGKNRVHFDLSVPDLDAGVQRLETLGAKTLSRSKIEPDAEWAVMADPEGNVFCVAAG
jgi:predicted enzyme related to lactoylglutathione lyase